MYQYTPTIREIGDRKSKNRQVPATELDQLFTLNSKPVHQICVFRDAFFEES